MPTAPKEVEINEKSHCGIDDRRADVSNFVCSVFVGINVVVLVLADHRFTVFINVSVIRRRKFSGAKHFSSKNLKRESFPGLSTFQVRT